MSTNEQRKAGKKTSAGNANRKSASRSSSERGDRISSRSRRRSKEARRRRQMRRLIQGILVGLCIVILLFSVWQLARIFLGYHSGDKEYDDLKEQFVLDAPVLPQEVGDIVPSGEDGEGEQALVPMTRIDLDALQEINPEAVGWIEIPDTIISYPMLHSTDNSYYLTHTFQNERNKVGSIFIETANEADFSDLHTIIYGHNMKNGSMFAGLKNYSSKSYWQAHPYVYIDLADGAHCYEIFSCHEAATSDITYTIGYAADDTYASFLESLKASCPYDTGVSVGVEDKVITLSTCTQNGQKRFVVHAKKVY